MLYFMWSMLRKKNKKDNNNLYIFEKYINSNYKSIPFNERSNNIGKTKYFPSVIKEWKNNIYVYNSNNIKNIPMFNINIDFLIKNYFNLYFNNRFIKHKLKSTNYKNNRLSINKIFISKGEIKHTNSKAIITIYAYNREKIALLKKIKELKKSFLIKVLSFLYKSNYLYAPHNKDINNYLYNKTIRALFYKELILLRRFKLRLSLNKYKFEEIFLYKLSKLISRFYNKKIELNIINLKSIILNSDLFTKILALKLRNRKASVLKMMSIILNKAVLPKVNRITEKGTMTKSIDFNLIENKYRNLNINSIIQNTISSNIKEGNLSHIKLDNLLNELYYSATEHTIPFEKDNYPSNKIQEIIFNSIKYKNMGGIRLEVKGRLTKRYRADRAIFKVKWKGGLKNIDSSYKGLSSVNMRGYIKPNLEYSVFTSKRRIGAFAVKGWISGK